jgi:hypothetical protein
MTQNVGGLDKILRIIAGIAIIIIGIAARSWWGALGLLPLVTAFIGWCPAYIPFGIKTCRDKNESEKQP